MSGISSSDRSNGFKCLSLYCKWLIPINFLKLEIKEQSTDLSFDFLATRRPNSQTIQQKKLKL